MKDFNRELPIGFYSKKHLISFILYVLLCLIIDILFIVLMIPKGIEGIVNLLAIIVVLLQFVVGMGWILFPIYYIEKKFNKNRDYDELKTSLEELISNNINRESKNYLRLILLRYSIIFDMVYATKLLKDVYLPRKTTETFNVTYYQAMFEFYITNGSHVKAKNILDSMREYKIPTNIFNKYSLLYSLYMENEVYEKELMVLNPVSKNFLERIISQFGLALYHKTNGDKEKFDLYKKHINKVNQNNPYFRQLTK